MEAATTSSIHREPRAVTVPAQIPKWAQTLFAFAVYAGFTVWFTWPVATDLGHTIYGAPGDLTGSIANLRELVEGGHNPFLPGTLPDFNAPEGQPITWALNLAVWPSMSMLYALAVPFGATAAFSLFTFFGYVASGLGTFLLVRRLTGHAWIALIIGFAYGFYPFVVVNGGGHNFFVHGWVFVLITWRMLELADRPTLRNGVLSGLAVILAISWAPYFILIGGVLYATLLVVDVVSSLRRGELRLHYRPLLVGTVIVVVYLGALTAVTLSPSDSALRVNPIVALTVYAARPLEYVLPPAGNILVGGTSGPYLASHMHGSNISESTLYLGVSILLLAAIGLFGAFRSSTPAPIRRISLAAAAVGVVAFAFSAPPQVLVLGHAIRFPSSYVFELTSTWRVYSRFVMVVMLAACLLAAFGLRFLAHHRRPPVQIAVLAAFSVIVPLDLYAGTVGDTATNRLVAPAIYDVLRRQPPGIVAQYPLYPPGYGDYQELFLQDAHGKPLLNGYTNLPQEGRDLALARLEDPATGPGLATLGVRYVLVPDLALDPPVVEPGKPGAGFRRIASGPYGGTTATLYRVTAKPGAPLVSVLTGFEVPEGPPGQQFRWLSAPVGKLELAGRCAPCVGTLRFTADSLARARRVVVRTAAGRLLASRRVARPTSFSVPVRFTRRTRLTITTTPGPKAIATEVPGSPDPRSVSLQISRIRFTARGGDTR